MPAPLILPSELTIYCVAELRPQWRAWVDAARDAADADSTPPDAFEVDGGAVSDIDAAGVQLLLSLFQAMAPERRPLRVVNPSSALAGACKVLGVSAALLDAEPAGGAA